MQTQYELQHICLFGGLRVCLQRATDNQIWMLHRSRITGAQLNWYQVKCELVAKWHIIGNRLHHLIIDKNVPRCSFNPSYVTPWSIGKRIRPPDERWRISFLITTNNGCCCSNAKLPLHVWNLAIEKMNNSNRSTLPQWITDSLLILNIILVGRKRKKTWLEINDLCRCVSSAILIWMRRQYYVNGSATCLFFYFVSLHERCLVEALTSIRSDS